MTGQVALLDIKKVLDTAIKNARKHLSDVNVGELTLIKDKEKGPLVAKVIHSDDDKREGKDIMPITESYKGGYICDGIVHGTNYLKENYN